MASPFPGMDPYLENPELWSGVHSRLIVAIADELVDHLSENYRVEVEKRVYCSGEDASLLVGIPDVAVATRRSAVSPTGTTAIKWVDRYEEIPKLQVFDSSTEIARKKSVTV